MKSEMIELRRHILFVEGSIARLHEQGLISGGTPLQISFRWNGCLRKADGNGVEANTGGRGTVDCRQGHSRSRSPVFHRPLDAGGWAAI